jgi:putative inorganic carbon (HCO3(-)) transporter
MLNKKESGIHQAVSFIDQWNWVLLLAAAPFLLFPSSLSFLTVLVVPTIWTAAWLIHGTPVPKTPLNTAVLIMLIMVLVSTWATYDVSVSLPKISGMILGLAVFFTITNKSRHQQGWWFCWEIFLVMGLGVALLSFIGTTWSTYKFVIIDLFTRFPKIISGFQGAEGGFHPNEVAGALLWVLPVYLSSSIYAFFPRFGESKKNSPVLWIYRLSIWLGTIFVSAVFVLTQSRSGYLGLGIVCLVMLVIAIPKKRRKTFILGLLIIIVILGLILTQTEVFQNLEAWFSGSVLADGSGLSLDSLEGRLEIWSRAIYGIQDFPLTGMGMNTFRSVVHVLYPLSLISPNSDFGHAHNEFLQAALDLGIPGLIAFLALYIISFWMLIQTWIISRDQGYTLANPIFPPIKPMILGLSGGLLAHFFYGLTDAIALGAKPGILLWTLFGLITGLYLQAQGSFRNTRK